MTPMPPYTGRFARPLIAAVVILVTLLLARWDSQIAEQWQAIFLLVIGYYFKDRQSNRSGGESVYQDNQIAFIFEDEMRNQFVLALFLLASTAWLFGVPRSGVFTDQVAGGWIAGVAIAIAFYFQNADTGRTTRAHNRWRSILGSAAIISTLLIFLNRTVWLWGANPHPEGITPIPLQWVALVFVIVAFYFNEKGKVEEPRASTDKR